MGVMRAPTPTLSVRDSVRAAAGASPPAMPSRAWYGSLRLLPVEFLVAVQPLGIDELPRRIHARVADANVLLNEVVARVRMEKQVALLAAMKAGGLRVHVATTIPGEVDEHLAERAARQGLDATKLTAIWLREVAPRLRVVDVGDPDVVELAEVAERDVSDLPTATLASILGPGSTWSNDRDLIDPGLAGPYVLELVLAIRDVCVLDARIYTTARGAEVVGRLGTELVRALARLDTRTRLTVGALVIAALAAAMIVVWRKPELREDLIDALQRIYDAILDELSRSYALQQDAVPKLPPPLEMGTSRPERVVARVLAVAPAPLSSDEVTMLVRRSHPTLDARVVRRTLGEHPMFVRAGRSFWQFGRALGRRV